MKPRRTFLAPLAVVCLYAGGCATATVKPAVAASVPPGRPLGAHGALHGRRGCDPMARVLSKPRHARFPSGFTVLEAYGQWRSARGEIHVLPSRILVVLHPSTPQADAAIEARRG